MFVQNVCAERRVAPIDVCSTLRLRELKRRANAPRQETMQHAKAKKLINQHCVEKMTR